MKLSQGSLRYPEISWVWTESRHKGTDAGSHFFPRFSWILLLRGLITLRLSVTALGTFVESWLRVRHKDTHSYKHSQHKTVIKPPKSVQICPGNTLGSFNPNTLILKKKKKAESSSSDHIWTVFNHVFAYLCLLIFSLCNCTLELWIPNLTFFYLIMQR